MNNVYYINEEILAAWGACSMRYEVCNGRNIAITPAAVRTLFRKGYGNRLEWLADHAHYEMEAGALRNRMDEIADRLEDFSCFNSIGPAEATEAAALLNEMGDILTRYKAGER